MMRKIISSSALLLCLSAPSFAGTVHDFGSDFSLASNPNGPYSYGYVTSLGGALTLLPDAETVTAGGSLEAWHDQSNALGLPAAYYNNSSQAFDDGDSLIQPGQFGMDPGVNNGEFAVTRLTLPTAGTFDLTASFFGESLFGTETDVYLLVNGEIIFSGQVTGFGAGSGPTFDSTITLAAGALLDVVVAPRNDGNNDATAATIRLAAVPEPSGLILLVSGIAATIVLGQFRRGFSASLLVEPQSTCP